VNGFSTSDMCLAFLYRSSLLISYSKCLKFIDIFRWGAKEAIKVAGLQAGNNGRLSEHL
jgi:hypothetical protein